MCVINEQSCCRLSKAAASPTGEVLSGRRADNRGCAARSMPPSLLPSVCMCARFGRGSAVVVCARRCACRLDVANIHRHAHHSSHRRWSCGATWSDMKRTCAACHEYSWHAPFVSSNSMVVVTNGGHSCSGRHSSPHAPFCTVLGAPWS